VLPNLSTRKLEKALAQAESYAEWRSVARDLDRKLGHERWRSIDQSSQYDYVSIRLRLDQLRSLRARHDYRGLLFTLNEGIHGNMGGMGKSSLYERALFGTKQLIVDYVEEICDALALLASPDIDEISLEEKVEFFRRARHCYGRSALLMSGSGTLLYFHLGVVKALSEHDLLPLILSGASGGSVVGAVVCSHTREELETVFDAEFLAEQMSLSRAPGPAFFGLRPRLLQLDEVVEMIDRMVPDLTFQEAYERSGRMLNVSVAPAETHQTSRLLNATTSPNVLIRKSVLASAAVPGIYPPVVLEARDKWGERQPYLPSRKWVDGSVSDDLPTKRLARLYGVNHYIVSQTNPAVLPFLTDSRRKRGTLAIIQDASRRTAREWLNAGAAILHRPLSRDSGFSKIANTFISLVNQDYIGDVNIIPRNRTPNLFKVLHHLDVDDIAGMIAEGERATWRRLEMIRVQTRIAKVLDDIVTTQQRQLIESQSRSGRRAA
jgi:NTE family protein